mgnify:CR=1 FL=1
MNGYHTDISFVFLVREYRNMSEQQQSTSPGKVIYQQATHGKNLTQVGRDYIRYLQLRFSSGNWVAIAMNIAILAFVAHGLTSSVKSFVGLVADLNSKHTLCSAEVNRLTIKLAQEVARTDGFLTETDAAAVEALAEANKLVTSEEELMLAAQRDDYETIEVEIVRDEYGTLGKGILVKVSEALDLLIDEMQYSISQRNDDSTEEI